jgi:hypothetical protein
VAHSIEIWQAVHASRETLLPLSERASEEDLPAGDDHALVELSRIYPALSRAIAEYLAR